MVQGLLTAFMVIYHVCQILHPSKIGKSVKQHTEKHLKTFMNSTGRGVKVPHSSVMAEQSVLSTLRVDSRL